MATASSIRTGFRFGPFILDLRSGDLSRNGRPIRLQEKPRSLLVALAERPGELITRAELHERLWPNDTFVDFENGLNAAMSKLREVLGDAKQSPRYIETVRGRGYRLIAKVEATPVPIATAPDRTSAVEESAGSASLPGNTRSASQAENASAGKTHRWKRLAAIFAVCLVTAVAIAFALRWRAAHAPRISIAVLPFTNKTGDPTRDYICDGITEELIARLGHLAPNQLRVIAPTSAQIYANSSKSDQQIARELNVQFLVEGSLQEQGANIRVATQLVRAQDQTRLWANVYEGDLSDQFEFEASVAEAVGHALSLRVPALSRVEYKPDKYEAHDAYLRGLYFFSQRSKRGFRTSDREFW